MDPVGSSSASATASIKTTESKRFKVKGVGVTKTFQSLLPKLIRHYRNEKKLG